MKRILILILILTFVGTSLLTKTEMKVKREPLRNEVSPTINHTIIIGTDDPGDILLDYDVQTPTATICPGLDDQLLGCEFDGTYIWVALFYTDPTLPDPTDIFVFHKKSQLFLLCSKL